ncbi:extracellular matrix protein 1 [Cebidichthys violaceus]|uniref:extracellular matrix protein 1 n=1 Tax=Cebidichthys violaceus TaxID=271503 RepID=UPI0035CA1161
MGSSGALVCSIAFVLILLSSASNDEHDWEQREVTFDKIIQEIKQPDSSMLQKEVDLADIFDPKAFPELVMMSPPEQFESTIDRGMEQPDSSMLQKEVDLADIFDPKAFPELVMMSPPEQLESTNDRGRPSFVPRSFGGPPILNYPVQFPLGRPTSDNLQAICLNGEHRPTYPKSYFPVSSFSQQKRKASAVNMAESWFRTCCKGNQTWEREVTLCCATQAWELSVQSFCEDDVSVKHRIYHCCKLRGNDMLNCFQNDAPNPNYEATEELPVPPLPSKDNFSFDPNACQRTVMTSQGVRGNRGKIEKKPSAPQKVDMSFPPGRPTADTIETLCRDQKQRPLYKINCLTGVGYEWLARQAKTINRIEKGFKHCCKKKHGVLNCADQKWREELNKYCVDKNGGQVDFLCCLGEVSIDRYNCFQDASPDPHYNMTSATEELSLHNICDTHKIVKKKFPVDFPLKRFVNRCCPLSEESKTACFKRELQEIAQECSSLLITHHCCRISSQTSTQCFSKKIMDAIAKATTVLRQKKKKRCPLS